MAHLLLIDDDPGLLTEQVRQVFPSPRHRVGVARAGAEGLSHFRADTPDVVLLGIRCSDECGLTVFKQLRHLDERIPVICIAGVNGANQAISAMKLGAYDYLFNPLEPNYLRQVVGEALELSQLLRKPSTRAEDSADADVEGALVGTSAAMREVYKAIGQVAAQDVPVLITGESGTGKELVARALHQHSKRASHPFLALNCAAIPDALLEAELFGHEKGAFTGADRKRVGKFEQCTGGTLFLDEIGDMPILTQAKMLRVMQEQAFERIGGNETVRTDVRVIAATHRNLKAWASEGRFRSDLYYRLGVFSIHLPPLRERSDDLPMLVRHFLQRFGRELGREIREVTHEAMQRLQDYSWPGNVRELQSVLKQSLLRATGSVLLPAFLPPLEGELQNNSIPANDDAGLEALVRNRLGSNAGELHAEVHGYVDRFLLTRVLEHTGGSQHQAARRLGIARETLRRRLRELGLHVSRSVTGDANEGVAELSMRE